MLPLTPIRNPALFREIGRSVMRCMLSCFQQKSISELTLRTSVQFHYGAPGWGVVADYGTAGTRGNVSRKSYLRELGVTLTGSAAEALVLAEVERWLGGYATEDLALVLSALPRTYHAWAIAYQERQDVALIDPINLDHYLDQPRCFGLCGPILDMLR